jgi:hypothetical protein
MVDRYTFYSARSRLFHHLESCQCVTVNMLLLTLTKVGNSTVTSSPTEIKCGTGTLSVWTNRSAKPVCRTGGDKAVPIGSVAVGNTKVLTVSELAAGAAGAKKLYAFADSKCVTQEIDKTNNQLTKSYTVK